ncbi:hypothetical protein ACIA8O_03720 [Kitasatospora sp. NPDC051853]|uniref:hypothetical protein n=1 Tax=Kitasatospora sp. NPDC051853 TaxID=3364058 RepID=UPI0037B3C86B
MTDPAGAPSAFENRCANTARLLAPCVGYFLERISFDSSGEEDALDLALREGPWKPDVVISLSRVRHLSLGNPASLSGSFVDEISLVHLPKLPHAWPAGAERLVKRFDGLEELVWLRIVGPATVDAVASLATVYTAISDDEISAAPKRN